MSLVRWIFPAAAAAAALAAGLAHAGDPVKLDKADLEKTLAGKSISYANINGSAAIVNFEKDGRVTYKSGGTSKPAVGTWQAGDDGRYCIKITTGNVQDHCRRVWKTDSGYALGGANGELIPINGLD
jgi:hypothetical protein